MMVAGNVGLMLLFGDVMEEQKIMEMFMQQQQFSNNIYIKTITIT